LAARMFDDRLETFLDPCQIARRDRLALADRDDLSPTNFARIHRAFFRERNQGSVTGFIG
jgi:hypothetical protein